MSADTVRGRRVVGVARWAARISAAALVLFWGAFFLEHLAWFADSQRLPPPRVFVLVGLHFLMLVGLLAGWKWELAGAVVALASSVPLFAAAAGKNFPWFASVTAVPSVLWLYCARKRTAAPAVVCELSNTRRRSGQLFWLSRPRQEGPLARTALAEQKPLVWGIIPHAACPC